MRAGFREAKPFSEAMLGFLFDSLNRQNTTQRLIDFGLNNRRRLVFPHQIISRKELIIKTVSNREGVLNIIYCISILSFSGKKNLSQQF
jgi:hypothetical protein